MVHVLPVYGQAGRQSLGTAYKNLYKQSHNTSGDIWKVLGKVFSSPSFIRNIRDI
jgi:hypothetical protein